MRRFFVALAAALLCLLAAPKASRGQEAGKSDELLPFVDAQEYWGFLNKNGKVVIQPTYEGARPFHEGIALVWKSGYPGYIDRNETLIWSPPDALDMSEEELTDLEIDLGDFYEGLARVKDKGRSGFIDRTGKYAIRPQFLSAGDFSGGLAWAETAEGTGFIRKDGTFAIKAQYDGASTFNDGLAPVDVGGKWGYINKAGQMVIKPQFDKTGGFSEGLASVGIADPGEKRGTGILERMKWEHNFPGKCGYIDKTGRIVIDAQFGEAGVFSEGLAAVRKGKAWGYIDKTGKILIDPQYELAEPFSEGLAAVFSRISSNPSVFEAGPSRMISQPSRASLSPPAAAYRPLRKRPATPCVVLRSHMPSESPTGSRLPWFEAQ